MQEHDRSNEKSVITSGYNLEEKFKLSVIQIGLILIYLQLVSGSRV